MKGSKSPVRGCKSVIVQNVSPSLLLQDKVLDLLRWRDCVQAVHCWELGIKAVVVLEQAQVSVSHTYAIHGCLVSLACSCCIAHMQCPV